MKWVDTGSFGPISNHVGGPRPSPCQLTWNRPLSPHPSQSSGDFVGEGATKFPQAGCSLLPSPRGEAKIATYCSDSSHTADRPQLHSLPFTHCDWPLVMPHPSVFVPPAAHFAVVSFDNHPIPPPGRHSDNALIRLSTLAPGPYYQTNGLVLSRKELSNPGTPTRQLVEKPSIPSHSVLEPHSRPITSSSAPPSPRNKLPKTSRIFSEHPSLPCLAGLVPMPRDTPAPQRTTTPPLVLRRPSRRLVRGARVGRHVFHITSPLPSFFTGCSTVPS